MYFNDKGMNLNPHQLMDILEYRTSILNDNLKMYMICSLVSYGQL